MIKNLDIVDIFDFDPNVEADSSSSDQQSMDEFEDSFTTSQLEKRFKEIHSRGLGLYDVEDSINEDNNRAE